MTTQAITGAPVVARPSNRLGFWSASVMALTAAAALGIALATAPARSGPFCLAECILYPYTDAAAFVPNDYLWMYAAILMAPALLGVTVSLYHTAAPAAKQAALLALCFAIIATTLHVANYFIQLTVIQPSLLRGETEALSLFSQYNPHGIFIALEDVGYLLTSAVLGLLACTLTGKGWVVRALRWLFGAAFVLTFVALAGLALRFGANLEYRFEVASITITWLAQISGGLLLARYFHG